MLPSLAFLLNPVSQDDRAHLLSSGSDQSVVWHRQLLKESELDGSLYDIIFLGERSEGGEWYWCAGDFNGTDAFSFFFPSFLYRF